MIIYPKQGRYYVQIGASRFSLDANELDMIDLTGRINFIFQRWPVDDSRSKLERSFAYADILDRYGNVYGDNFEDIHDAIHTGIDINLQDQTTPVIIQKFNQVQESTTLAAQVAIDDREITLADATGAVDGSHIILFDPASVRFTTFTQVGAPAGNVITLDSPLDFAYPDGTFVDIATTDMAVNGAGTTQIFGLRGIGTPAGVELTFDVTRIVITLLCNNAPAYNLFGDLPKLANGVFIRKRNGEYFNIANIKTNGEWAGIMYDLSAADAVNPNQGQNGWIGRQTFAGQNKMGVAVRLPIGEDLEIHIQDDLTDLDLFEVVAEGHITVK